MFIIDLIVKMCEHNHQSDLISLSFRTRCLLRQDIFRGKGPGTLFNFRDISWTFLKHSMALLFAQRLCLTTAKENKKNICTAL